MDNKKNILESIFKENTEKDFESTINELTPEETKAALEILDEEIDGTSEDTPLEKVEPKGMDTRQEEEEEDDEDLGKTSEGGDTDDEDKDEGEEPSSGKEFVIDEDFVESQPEADRGILNKYLGKGKKDIAMAVANAIAVKNPILKDDKEAIRALGERFLNTKTKEELIAKLVESQRLVGVATSPKPSQKIEYPDIPENHPTFSKMLEKETLKRLKAKYPDMPDVESMEDEDYKEWRRDLDIENPDHNFKADKAKYQEEVKTELRKLFLVQKELGNLYDESPSEVLQILNEETYPRLKALNDRPLDVLYEDLQNEVEVIRGELKKVGLTEKDLGIDLSITKDKNGYPYNKVINSLVVSGKTPDGQPIVSREIIGRAGKSFWLIPNQIYSKFMKEYNNKIMTALIDKKIREDRLRREELKETAIIQPKVTGGSGKSVVSVEDIDKETNPETIKQLLKELEKQF